MVVQNHCQAFPDFWKKDFVKNNNNELGDMDESDGGDNNLELLGWSDSDSETSDY